jgi:hypothetical protein
MKKPKSKSGAVIAGGYVLLTLAAASPLLQEGGYIGHGNGLSFLLAIALTAPLSVVLLQTAPSATACRATAR